MEKKTNFEKIRFKSKVRKSNQNHLEIFKIEKISFMEKKQIKQN